MGGKPVTDTNEKSADTIKSEKYNKSPLHRTTFNNSANNTLDADIKFEVSNPMDNKTSITQRSEDGDVEKKDNKNSFTKEKRPEWDMFADQDVDSNFDVSGIYKCWPVTIQISIELQPWIL